MPAKEENYENLIRIGSKNVNKIWLENSMFDFPTDLLFAINRYDVKMAKYDLQKG